MATKKVAPKKAAKPAKKAPAKPAVKAKGKAAAAKKPAPAPFITQTKSLLFKIHGEMVFERGGTPVYHEG